MGSRARRRKQASLPRPEAAADIARELGIGSWDVLVVADGSCAQNGLACGWAALVEDRLGNRELVTGAESHGGAAAAEILPFARALAWYFGPSGPGRAESGRCGRPLEAHCVTDSSSVVDIAAGTAARRAAKEAWAALEALPAKFCRLSFHHVPRATYGRHVLADAAARGSRRGFAALDRGPAQISFAEPKDAHRHPPQPRSVRH